MRDNYYDEYDEEYVRPRKKHHIGFFCFLALLLIAIYFKGIPYLTECLKSWTEPVYTEYNRAENRNGSEDTAIPLEDGNTIPEDTSEALEAMAEIDPKVKPILQNPGRYPEKLLESLARNSELLDFTLDYPKKKGTFSNENLSNDYKKGLIPMLIQWDENWGYARYGDGIIALDGCGPTCLSMVLVGLTGDTSQTPKAVADFSEQNGYLDEKTNSTLWTLMSEGAQKLGLSSREIPLSESRMTRELSKGHPIICCMGPGDFTTQGHFIVLCGVQDGAFLIRDPNSMKRSNETWSYETLKTQIRNLWAFSS